PWRCRTTAPARCSASRPSPARAPTSTWCPPPASARKNRSSWSPPPWPLHCCPERQRDGKGRADADLALAGQQAAVGADDAVGDPQAEAGPLADLLGGEEGIGDVLEDLGRDAGAGVADGHL